MYSGILTNERNRVRYKQILRPATIHKSRPVASATRCRTATQQRITDRILEHRPHYLRIRAILTGARQVQQLDAEGAVTQGDEGMQQRFLMFKPSEYAAFLPE